MLQAKAWGPQRLGEEALGYCQKTEQGQCQRQTCAATRLDFATPDFFQYFKSILVPSKVLWPDNTISAQMYITSMQACLRCLMYWHSLRIPAHQALHHTRVEAVWILTALCQLLCSSACIMSVQLQSVSSAVFSQLSCNLSALAYSVMQFICCDRPDLPKNHLSFEVRGSFAVRHLSYNLPTQSWSVSLAAVCQRSLSAQLQYGNSAAMCQLSCTLLAQIKLVSSAARSAATFWLSCNLSSFGLCPLVAMNTDICKRQSDEACNNHVAHCYADALLQILAILAKQICKWALSRMARIISESHLEQWLLCEDLEA